MRLKSDNIEEKTWIGGSYFLPRYCVALLDSAFQFSSNQNTYFIYSGRSSTMFSLVVDSIYDKIPFYVFLSDHDEASTLFKAALRRILKDKKTKLAAYQIFLEFAQEVIPRLQQQVSSTRLSEYPKILECFNTIHTLCYLDKSERQ